MVDLVPRQHAVDGRQQVGGAGVPSKSVGDRGCPRPHHQHQEECFQAIAGVGVTGLQHQYGQYVDLPIPPQAPLSPVPRKEDLPDGGIDTCMDTSLEYNGSGLSSNSTSPATLPEPGEGEVKSSQR